MKPVSGAAFVSAVLMFAVSALAQTPSAPSAGPLATSGPSAPTADLPSSSAAPIPVPSGKRFACAAASSGLKGQERRDQMQVCLVQARLDCLKQAIDQKIVGPQRKEFLKSCVQ